MKKQLISVFLAAFLTVTLPCAAFASETNIIINTVPSVIIDRKILEKLNKNCIIIDVASAPYGTDFAVASEFGINAIQCPSLPGKVAPKTAGEIIADLLQGFITQICYSLAKPNASCCGNHPTKAIMKNAGQKLLCQQLSVPAALQFPQKIFRRHIWKQIKPA